MKYHPFKTHLIIPSATPADWRWREYKGYTLACGDCVVCEVVKGKVVVVSSNDDLQGITSKRKQVIERKQAA